MQANCPQCGQRLTVDDARAPEKPFAVRCPKCQGTVRFPGRGEAGGGASAAGGAPGPAASGAPAGSAASAEGTPDLSRMRRELTLADSSRQVLVGVSEASLATTLARPLAALGYTVETLDTEEEGGRLLEQGIFDVVIISPSFSVAGRGETVYQRITRLSPDARRSLFLVLVEDRFTTGDGGQAWAMQADLVVNPRDAPAVEPLLLNTIAERRRLYQAYNDARRRFEQAD